METVARIKQDKIYLAGELIESTDGITGNRNYIKNGNFYWEEFTVWDNWGTANKEIFVDDYNNRYAHIYQYDTEKWRGIRQRIEYFKKETVFTVSFIAFRSAAYSGGLRLLIHQTGDGNNNPQVGTTFKLTTEPQLYSYTFTSANADKTAFVVMIGGEDGVPFDIYVTNIKFEQWHEPTKYDFAPEDAYNYIEIVPPKLWYLNTGFNREMLLVCGEAAEYTEDMRGRRNHFSIKKILEKYGDSYSITETTESFNGMPVYCIERIDNNYAVVITFESSLEPSGFLKEDSITFSVWVKRVSQNDVVYAEIVSGRQGRIVALQEAEKVGEWERLVVSYSNDHYGFDDIMVYFHVPQSKYGQSGKLYFAGPKLEYGLEPTNWNVAPEDRGFFFKYTFKNFGLSFDISNIMAQEFIEGYPFVKPVIDNSLVLWLDYKTGNNAAKTDIWEDLSGKGNHGKLHNFAFNSSSGWSPEGLRFDGVDDYVSCGNSSSLNLTGDFTLEMFIRIPPDGNFGGMTKGQYGTWVKNAYGLRGQTTFCIFSSDGTTSEQLYTDRINNDQVTHVVGVRLKSQNTVKMYINGQVVATTETKINTAQIIPDDLCIGVAYNNSPENRSMTKGYILVARAYNRALFDAEVLQNYKAGYKYNPYLAK